MRNINKGLDLTPTLQLPLDKQDLGKLNDLIKKLENFKGIPSNYGSEIYARYTNNIKENENLKDNIQLVNQMLNKSIFPNKNVICILINRLRRYHLNEAYKLYEVAEKKELADGYIYDTMISGFFKIKNPNLETIEKVFKLFNNAKHAKDRIKKETYKFIVTTTLYILAKSDNPDANTALKLLDEVDPDEMDEMVYNTILDVLAKSMQNVDTTVLDPVKKAEKKAEIVDHALQLLDKANKANMADIITYNNLLNVLAKVEDPSEEMVTQALKLLNEAKMAKDSKNVSQDAKKIRIAYVHTLDILANYMQNVLPKITDPATKAQKNTQIIQEAERLLDNIKDLVGLPELNEKNEINLHDANFGEIYFWLKDYLNNLPEQNKRSTIFVIYGKGLHSSTKQGEHLVKLATQKVMQALNKVATYTEDKLNPGRMKLNFNIINPQLTHSKTKQEKKKPVSVSENRYSTFLSDKGAGSLDSSSSEEEIQPRQRQLAKRTNTSQKLNKEALIKQLINLFVKGGEIGTLDQNEARKDLDNFISTHQVFFESLSSKKQLNPCLKALADICFKVDAPSIFHYILYCQAPKSKLCFDVDAATKKIKTYESSLTEVSMSSLRH